LPEAVLVEFARKRFQRKFNRAKSAVIVSASFVESTNGIFVFGSRLGKLAYTEADLEFGAGLVAQAGVAFENSWYVRETIERKKMEQELALAASIQEGLFPEFLPRLERLRFVGAQKRPGAAMRRRLLRRFAG
jgi:serine phosphatase RsbU (regulator of sigma subunit)